MFEDLDSFNNSTGFDGSVDFDYNENTGELSALFPDFVIAYPKNLH